MADLQVVAVLVAKPESVDVVRSALAGLVAPTLAEEGCLGYELTESAAAPGTFITIERWRAQSDLDAHFGTPHVAEVLGLAGDHLAEPPGVHPLVPVPTPG